MEQKSLRFDQTTNWRVVDRWRFEITQKVGHREQLVSIPPRFNKAWVTNVFPM